MTSLEVYEFWDLPEVICDCIKTEGLIETCLKYPDLRIILAGTNPQSGYNSLLRSRFRGIRELETRQDRSTYLLKKYLTIDPHGYDPTWDPVDIGAYNFNIYFLEIIFSQYANLKPLTNEEKIELIDKAIIIYDKMKLDLEQYSLFGLECTATLMGRLMYADEYKEMVDLYSNNDLVLELIEFYGPTSLETVDIIYDTSLKYLKQLKDG